jgi:hypothetical protein
MPQVPVAVRHLMDAPKDDRVRTHDRARSRSLDRALVTAMNSPARAPSFLSRGS